MASLSKLGYKDAMNAFLDLYMTTEKQFIDFDEIVPHDHNPDTVYSPGLYSILQSSGSQVDGLFRVIVHELGLSPKAMNFPKFYDALNSKGLLTTLKVVTRRSHRTLHPFTTNRPDWWKAYNDSKHNLPEGLYEVNLGRTLDALGGVFLLLYIGLACLGRTTPGTNVLNRTDFPDWILNASLWEDFEKPLLSTPDQTLIVHRGSSSISLGTPRVLSSLHLVDFISSDHRSALFDLPQICLPLIWE